ncbi:MAG TPA: hypothetical protein VG938_06200 [Verrucomicrobiae bacterium]|jgi:hypothetical protein|nr:hypothetical protein [Verrucomicrobiae bacterium]
MRAKDKPKREIEKKSGIENFSGSGDILEEANKLLPAPPQVINTLAPPDSPPPPKRRK